LAFLGILLSKVADWVMLIPALAVEVFAVLITWLWLWFPTLEVAIPVEFSIERFCLTSIDLFLLENCPMLTLAPASYGTPSVCYLVLEP
jgi:hypothetical protein